ncbi:MAG: hypothetical protein R3C53_04335 [Pirellulaceae bacterium]
MLESYDAAGTRTIKLNTGWQLPHDSNSGRLLPSENGDYFAWLQAGGQSVLVFDSTSNQSTTLELSGRTVDAGWLRLNGAAPPRLAVVTSDSRTVLLDPSNHEQLSGSSAAPPLAVIAYEQVASPVGGLVFLQDRSVEQLQLSEESTLSRIPGRPAAFAKPSSPGVVADKLGFTPAAGPWKSIRTEQGNLTLAHGWLAADEPAVFMLDNQFNQLWHARMPLELPGAWHLTTAWQNPATGQPVWAVVDETNTVHLFRADGRSNDHFRVAERIVGVSLLAEASQLLLRIVTPHETITHALR